MSTNTAIQRFTSSLDYGVTPGAPASISRQDIDSWKVRVSPEVAHHFVERYEELQREYHALVDSYEINKLVYNSQIGFQPVLGHTYYLYEKTPGHRFLSLLSPIQTHWAGFIAAVRLNTSYTWERIPISHK